MIHITRLIGKKSSNIALQYLRVNLILPGFFRPKIFMGSKNDSPPCCLENGSLYIHATWQTYTFLLFVNIFPEKNFWWSCYDIDVVTIFKTKGKHVGNYVITKYDFVTSHVIVNIYFLERAPYIRKTW